MSDSLATVQINPVIQLFTSRSQRTFADFEMTTENMADVVQVCQLVGGLPLALEVAAAWVSLLTPQQIATDLTKSLALFSTTQKDVPVRQQEIEVILAYGWRQLTAVAQQTMTALSIFTGVCDTEAATAVLAGDTLGGIQHLSTLINAAPWRIESPGLFSLHPLVKQYATGLLPDDSEVAQRHAAYFLGMLDLGGRLLEESSMTDSATIINIQRVQEDIFTAWHRAIKRQMWDILVASAVSFGNYLFYMQQ